MGGRGRRLATAALLLVLGLYGGKWITGLLAARWWAATISPEAVAAVTRWQALQLSLESIAVALASAWFVLQVWMVRGSIDFIHVRRDFGDRVEWHPIPERILVIGAIALGVMLGLLTGTGAGSAVQHVALWMVDPHFGFEDPTTGMDLGRVVSLYPVLVLAQRFVLTVALLGLAVSVLLYLMVDAAAGKQYRPFLKQGRRLHYCLSLVAIAAALLFGAALLPLKIATAVDAPLGHAIATTQVSAAYLLVGIALATLILTFWWGISERRPGLLLSAWLVLAVAQIAVRLVVPAFVADQGESADRSGQLRQLDSLLYGIRLVEQGDTQDSLPPVAVLWEPELLGRWTAGSDQFLAGAGATGSGPEAAWLLAMVAPPDSLLKTVRLAAARVAADGSPLELGPRLPSVTARSMPGAEGWKLVDHGVRVGGPLRRVALAWALQAPGVLTLDSDTEIDWWLDPRDRTGALVPALEWRATGLALGSGEPAWILSGFATIEHAPRATRVPLGDRTVAGMVPVAIAVVTASSGKVDLYLDPAADSVGTAWARWLGPVVGSADRIPTTVGRELPYPMEWFTRQLTVLAQPHWQVGSWPAAAARVSSVWAPGPGALQAMVPAADDSVVLLTASRVGSGAGIRVDTTAWQGNPADIVADIGTGAAVPGHLRDSVSAAGDSLVVGAVRWHPGPEGMVSWQPFSAVGGGGVHLMWLVTTAPGRTGGDRTPQAAWRQQAESPDSASGAGAIQSAALRTWIMRADSALARGDLGAFARAWEAIRATALQPAPQ